MQDLAPKIYRQRLVIEGYPESTISDMDIKTYLQELSQILKMKVILSPITSMSDQYGWAGWIHWETSGAHFYAWDQPTLFFSVDIYTCKRFDPEVAVQFTKNFFNATKIVSKGF